MSFRPYIVNLRGVSEQEIVVPRTIEQYQHAHPGPPATSRAWVYDVPAYRALKRAGQLDFDTPVTVITGENGVGKSTLLEAIALDYGFAAMGGPYSWSRPQRYLNPLAGLAVVSLGSQPKDGYFLRAETHFNVATIYQPRGLNLHAMSHGESVMEVVHQAFDGRGLYLLDEPESGLSFVRQMSLLAEISQAAAAGAQFVIATHSPVLAAIPGAQIYEFYSDGTFASLADATRTTTFKALRDFLAEPFDIAEHMAEYMAARLPER